MFTQTRLRFVAAAVIFGSTWMIGCKGGGGGGMFARKGSQTAKQPAGPSLGSPSKFASGQKEVAALESPESVASHTTRSSASRASQAKPQLTCPVDGKSLGSAGTPSTVTLKGEPIFVCSDACAKKAQKDPDKYLKKVHLETAARN